MKEQIRMCVDRVPSVRALPKHAALAVRERPSNVAMGLDQCPAPGLMMPAHIAFLTAKRWKDGRVLRVAFLGGTQAQRKLVRDTVPVWEQYCSITFTWDVPVAASDVRVAFMPGQGSYSMIGTDALGVRSSQETVNFGWDDQATILHEFGHVLGCIHEHQSPEAAIPWNREACYRYYGGPPNNWDRETINNNIFAKYSAQVVNDSAYDPLSIMHYAIDAQLLTDPSRATGWNKELSTLDKNFVGKMYPKAAAPPVVSVPLPVSGTYRAVKDAAGNVSFVLSPPSG